MTQHTIDIDKANEELKDATAHEVLHWVYRTFEPSRVKLSTSFGAEGSALIHMLISMGIMPRVFFIDTCRNFQETYDVWHEFTERYGLKVESFGPDPADIAELTREHGPNMFYADVESRKLCCYIRKVKPLKRALADADAWIAALRRGQSEARAGTPIVSFSEEHGVYKICPIAKWSEEDVWEYVRNNNVPYNALYDKGFPSIGCAPCTRPVRPAEGKRASRWWWEEDPRKECGIHIEDGKVVRKPKGGSYSI
ncbi:phosphoadenylyl-sulfate reductase [bacterium]|nr:phosphoadenylyl-sulfate reductase [bacterium]